MTTATTAAEAFDRYQHAYDVGALVQGSWHERNGKDLACALGVIGDEVNGVSDCPAEVMPRWLAQQTVWFFDGQSFDDAKTWGLAFYAELKRLGGKVPFSVIHDWQANVVGPLAIKTAEKQSRDKAAHEALMTMQAKALGGEKFTADQWRPILKAAFLDIYKWRYRAYADADADAYAYAYAYADAYAYANAYANANANAYRTRMKALADGMVDCLKRVPTPEPA